VLQVRIGGPSFFFLQPRIPMDPIKKTALRAAVLIHEQAAGKRHQNVSVYLPEYSWENIQQIRRQIDKASRRGWHGAAARLTEDLAGAMDGCRRELENALRVLQSCPPVHNVASASDIYRDILALSDEFEGVDIDLVEHELSVTTDRIVLEHIEFGPFQIRLDWHLLGSSPAYRVVALDPNPAAKNEDVTHPHVQDEHLCEGEGRSAVQAALGECRLHDFYLLVSQLLHTYGQGSAYVELDNWDGTPCDDCGDWVDEDDRYYCQRCDAVLCGSCSTTCQGCQESFCSNCLSKCAACGGEYCSSCLETCRVCHKQFCQDCCEAGLCQRCHTKQNHEEHEHDLSECDPNEAAVVST
jgi:hypothetical protein